MTLNTLRQSSSVRCRPGSVRLALALAIVLATVPQVCGQGKYNPVLGIGDTAPGWQDLTGVDDEQHSMADLSAARVLVVCFTSNTCPYSVDYEDRLIRLHETYSDDPRGVELVIINSNAGEQDDLAHMQQRAREKQFPFRCLKDADQSVVKAWGAIYTPEFFVLDAERRVVYMGAMDDNTAAERVQQRYVEQAVDATLNGRPVPTAETPARGCAIRFPRRRRPVPESGPPSRP